MASPSAGAPALKYGDVNIVTPSPGEVKGLIASNFRIKLCSIIIIINENKSLIIYDEIIDLK